LRFSLTYVPQTYPTIYSFNQFKEEIIMTQVILGENEGIESALRRFKREVSKAGIFPDVKKHRHFETPLQKRKRKAVAKQKQRQNRFRY
jgi:small subunit ribosomal protein S21